MIRAEEMDFVSVSQDRFVADEDIVAQVLKGKREWFEALMRRYNQRLFRVSRSIVGTDEDAEEVVQETYLLAYRYLSSFEGRSKFSTWLTRIAVHEALRRNKRLQRIPRSETFFKDDDPIERVASLGRDPEATASNEELGEILEEAVDSLPDAYRTVFVLRQIEGLDTADTADHLGIGYEAVKTRLHRARSLLQRRLKSRLGEATAYAFRYLGPRCDRLVDTVLRRLSM